MMKKILFILIALVVSQASAQIQTTMNHEFVLIIPNTEFKAKVAGSPYYLGDDFRSGIVRLNELEPLEALMRYDVGEEVIEIKFNPDDTEIYKLPLNAKADYQILSRNLVWDEMVVDGRSLIGYFIEYYRGNSISFLGKPVASVSEPEKAKTGYEQDKPARISIDEVYLLEFEDGRVEEIRLKTRDFKKVFDSGKGEEYLKDNRIRDVEDVIGLLKVVDAAGN